MAKTNIPVDAAVRCTDGRAGFIDTIIVNPVLGTVTHIAVQIAPNKDRIVPLERVTDIEDERVLLDCTIAELKQMPEFTETHYIKVEDPDYAKYQSGAYQYPYVTQVWDDEEAVEREQVPEGELALHRGTKVAAVDGDIGVLEEFVVDENSGQFTHIVLRKGHLWGRREITIPLSAVDYVKDEKLYLKLTKAEIDSLPSGKVKRHYRR